MKSTSLYVFWCAAFAALWFLSCAKPPASPPPSGGAPVTKPPQVVQAPEGKHVHEGTQVMLADKAPEEAEAVVNPTKADAASLEKGKKLYAGKCALCHGEKGDGKGPKGIGLTPPPADLTSKEMMEEHTDGALFWAIGAGGKPMPGFAKSLSEEERWHLVNYIRTFAK